MKRFLFISLSLFLLGSIIHSSNAQTWGNNDDLLKPLSTNLENGMVVASPPTTTIIIDDILYFTDYYGFHIYNFSNPASPIKLSTLPFPGKTLHFDISGDYAYICNDLGCGVVDITDSYNPVIEHIDFVGYKPYRIIVDDETLFLAAVNGVYAYSIKDIQAYEYLGYLEIPSSTVTFAGFLKKDNYIYYTNQSFLHVIDVSNPQMMFTVSSRQYTGGGSCWGNMQIQDNYLYVATTLRLHIFDISDPSNPTIKYNGLPSSHTIYEILVDGDVMILNHQNNGYFTTVDISDPTNPVAVFRHDGNWFYGHNILGTLKDNILLAFDGSKEGYNGYGIHCIDISDNNAPVLLTSLKSLPGYTRSVSVATKNNQKYAFVGQSNGNTDAGSGLLRVLNITHLDEPYLEGTMEAGHDIVSVATLSDNWLAVASGYFASPIYKLAFSLVNIEDPTTPFMTDIFNASDQFTLIQNNSMCTYNNVGYMVDKNFLYIFKENDGAINLISQAVLYGQHGFGVYANNPDYVYVAGGNYGLQLYNISNPNNPFMVNYYAPAGQCWDVYVDNGIACAAAYGGGLAILDVSQNMVVPLTQTATVSPAISVVMQDNIAYVGTEDSRIQMFDISNPAEPISKGWYYTCGTRINSMLIDKSSNKSNLFVANELALTILEIDSEVGTTEINSNTNLQTQIAPNPASSIAYLDINLPSHNKVEAKLYNLNGQLVKTLVNQEFMSGRLQLELDISNVPAGVYMVEVNTNEHRKTEKLIIK